MTEEIAVKVGEDPCSPGKRVSARPKVFQSIDASKPASSLTWKSLSFSVATKDGEKQVLKDLNGKLTPGELTCILGPSGSGKTSLLNILSGRVRASPGSSIGGQIHINNNLIEPWQHQHLFGYVMQEDTLFATETPREVLSLAAKLKLKGIKEAEVKSLIADMIESLGLTKCADTIIGNEIIKGISGGEKKRTAISVELMTNPTMCFLDEPTSGLDTAAAYKVVEVLKDLTKLRQSVLCTIHQPSSEIFHLFDNAIFLAKGQVIYQGKPSGIKPHFEALGFQCPAEYNPADFVMFLIETADDATFDKLLKGAQVTGETLTESDTESKKTDQSALPPPPQRKGPLVELSVLFGRALRNAFRDKASLGARYGSTIFLNLLFSVIFFQTGVLDKEDYDLQSHQGAVTFVGINAMFGCAQPQLLTFPLERGVFLREHSAQMYGVVPYFLSKTLIEIPMLLLQMLLQWGIVYWLMGFNGNFLWHVGGTTLIGAASASMAVMVSCMVRDVKTAAEVGPLLFVPQILFAGFFIKMEQIPVFMRWVQYTCSLKWGMNLILLNEFNHDDNPMGARMLELNDVEEDLTGLYVLIMFAIFVVPRIIGAIILTKKSKTVYGS